jgi:putative copper export protein
MMGIILALAFHILGAVIWVGGMFAAYVCLRPAAGSLEASHRLQLWSAVRRFIGKTACYGLYDPGRVESSQRGFPILPFPLNV